jgi:signal transduction histidine kinase
MNKKTIYYFVPLLLAFIMFAANFLSTSLFQVDVQNFTVWFVLSIFAFVCGWLINKLLGWKHGGKIVFAVIVATVIISIAMVSLFNDYFGVNRLLTENLVLYPLRNIMLGAIGFFGMTLAELLSLQNEVGALTERNNNFESNGHDEKKQTEFAYNEAKLKAEQIIFDAKKKAEEYEASYRTFEYKLKELVQMEKELIKQYEDDDKKSN